MFIFDLFNNWFTERALKDFVKESEKSDCEDSKVDIFTKPSIKFSSNKYVNKFQIPISEKDAFMIANLDENLKTDFCKNDNRNISYINFNNYNIDQITYNNELHWHIEITKGDISWIDDYETFSDGFLVDEDLKKLQCLININTGKYLYFPQYKKEF